MQNTVRFRLARDVRSREPATVREPFAPPEDWHEPHNHGGAYRVIVQAPGEGYCHVVTPEQIRERLATVPQEFLRGLEVVQLSR